MIEDTLSNALAVSRYIYIHIYIIKKCVCNLCPPTVSSYRAIFSASCFLRAGILEETLKKSVLNVIFGVSSMIRGKSGEDRFNLGLRLQLPFELLLKARLTKIDFSESQTAVLDDET